MNIAFPRNTGQSRNEPRTNEHIGKPLYNTHARREALHAVWVKNNKIRRPIDENAEKPTPTDVLGDE